MLILPRQKAIFYHVYKVAGSSVRNALRPYASKWQIAAQQVNHWLRVARLPHSGDPLLSYHPRLADVRDRLGESFYDYYRFAFVRDPLDWHKSLYFYMLKKPHLPGNTRIAGMTFEEYLAWRMDNELRYQSDFLYDGSERLVTDLFHFESITADFDQLAKRLGISCRLPHINKAGSGQRVTISDPVLRRFRELHEKEYSVLGYTLP